MWQARVAEWRASGKTAEEFSTGQDFRVGTLRWWSSRRGSGPRRCPGWAVRRRPQSGGSTPGTDRFHGTSTGCSGGRARHGAQTRAALS
ncbi:MAG: hypothetical protein ACRENC_02175 [Gemmatimonadaceae bacterium]